MNNKFARFSGMGFQMLATIGFFVYAGLKLDEWIPNKMHGFTLTLSLLGVGGSLYMFIKQLPKE